MTDEKNIDYKIVTPGDAWGNPSRYVLLTNGEAVYDRELDIVFKPNTNEEYTDYRPQAADVEKMPNRYRILEGGAVMDRKTGKLVGHLGHGPYLITKENARAMVAIKKHKAVKSQMRGLALAAGVELAADATDEEVLQSALNGIEALTGHMAKTFMQSENIRGMGESYSRLVAPFVGSQADVDDGLNAQEREELEKLRELAKMVKAALENGQAKNNTDEFIDGEIKQTGE